MTTDHTARAAYAPGAPGSPRAARPGPSRRQLLGGTAGALGLALAACSGSSGGSASGGSTVSVVTHDSFTVSDSLIKAFTADTGYELSIVNSGDAGELVNKLILTGLR